MGIRETAENPSKNPSEDEPDLRLSEESSEDDEDSLEIEGENKENRNTLNPKGEVECTLRREKAPQPGSKPKQEDGNLWG